MYNNLSIGSEPEGMSNVHSAMQISPNRLTEIVYYNTTGNNVSMVIKFHIDATPTTYHGNVMEIMYIARNQSIFNRTHLC